MTISYMETPLVQMEAKEWDDFKDRLLRSLVKYTQELGGLTEQHYYAFTQAVTEATCGTQQPRLEFHAQRDRVGRAASRMHWVKLPGSVGVPSMATSTAGKPI